MNKFNLDTWNGFESKYTIAHWLAVIKFVINFEKNIFLHEIRLFIDGSYERSERLSKSNTNCIKSYNCSADRFINTI